MLSGQVVALALQTPRHDAFVRQTFTRRIMRMGTEGRLDPDTGSEFRRLLREARGQLLRRVSVTNDEVQGLTDHESGALDDGSGSAGAAEVLDGLGGGGG